MNFHFVCLPYVLVLTLPLIFAGIADAQIPTSHDFDFDKPQDIAFFGDSITHTGAYHQSFHLFLVTRYPGKDVWTRNHGYAGERAAGALKRNLVAIDFAPSPSDVAFVFFGANDVRRDHDLYRRTMNELIVQLQALGTRVIVMSPTPYDSQHTHYPLPEEGAARSTKVKEFVSISKEIARERNLLFIDVHSTMDVVNKEGQEINPKFSVIKDRVHPFNGGQEIMLYDLVKALGLREEVYDVKLTRSGQVEYATGAEMVSVQRTDSGISFTLKETALPFPSEHRFYKYIPFDEELNRMRLTVDGLDEGQYALAIDGKQVGVWPAVEWAKGVDLAGVAETPQYRQAKQWHQKLVKEKHDLEEAIAHARNLRYEVRRTVNFQDPPEDWIDKNPEEFLRQANARYDQLVAETSKKPGGWQGHIYRHGREALANWEQIHADLAELRKAVATQPSSFTHVYQIERAKEDGVDQ